MIYEIKIGLHSGGLIYVQHSVSHECHVTRKFPSLAIPRPASSEVVKERAAAGSGTQWKWLNKKDFGAKDFPLHDYPAWSST